MPAAWTHLCSCAAGYYKETSAWPGGPASWMQAQCVTCPNGSEWYIPTASKHTGRLLRRVVKYVDRMHTDTGTNQDAYIRSKQYANNQLVIFIILIILGAIVVTTAVIVGIVRFVQNKAKSPGHDEGVPNRDTKLYMLSNL